MNRKSEDTFQLLVANTCLCDALVSNQRQSTCNYEWDLLVPMHKNKKKHVIKFVFSVYKNLMQDKFW